MINTLSHNQDPRLLEDLFYANKFYFSYSGLNRLLYAPRLFYTHYVLGQKDDKTSQALLEGKVIHCLMLDADSFDKQFILLPGNMPSENPKKVLDKVYEKYLEKCQIAPEDAPVSTNLEDYEDEILEALKEINLHQSLKTDAQRLEKILTDANKEYFEFLNKQSEKEIVDIPTYDKCLLVAEQLKNHSQVSDILGLNNESQQVQVFNEIPIQTDIEGFSFGLKGILDNVKVDWDKKIISISDLKTTSKSLVDFRETIDFWNLWLQAALYKRMVIQEFILSNNLDLSEWKITFTFVVVDKYNQVYPFPISDETMAEWEKKADEKLKEAEWHYSNRRFDLPYALAASQVVL